MLSLTPRGLIPKLAFVSVFAAICLGITTLFPAPVNHDTTPQCVKVMVNGYRTLDAKGIWTCLTPKLRQTLFTNAGLDGEADMQKSLFASYAESGVSVKVKLFDGNPICGVPSGAQQSACGGWIMYLTPIVAGVPVLQSAGSLTVFIDQFTGKIWALA